MEKSLAPCTRVRFCNAERDIYAGLTLSHEHAVHTMSHWIFTILILVVLGAVGRGESVSQEEKHLCQGLKAHYRFDEGAGLNVSDSIGGNTGLIEIINHTTVQNIWSEDGRIGSGIRFHNKAHYVSLPATRLWNSTESTIVIWVKLYDREEYQYIVYADVFPFPDMDNETDHRRRHDLRIANDELRSEVWTATGSNLELEGPTLNSSSWQQLAAVINATHYSIFVDGVLEDSKEGSSITHVPHSVDSIWIGARPGDEDGIIEEGAEGTMDELMFYDRPLSGRELQSLLDTKLLNTTMRACPAIQATETPSPSISPSPLPHREYMELPVQYPPRSIEVT